MPTFVAKNQTFNIRMKKFLLAVAAVAALVACSGKSGMEKELVGNYTAKPEIEIADSTDFGAQMAAAMLSQMKMEMNFKGNGTGGHDRFDGEQLGKLDPEMGNQGRQPDFHRQYQNDPDIRNRQDRRRL